MKSKKILAIVLATSMMLGSSITALADEPVTSGGTNGSGSNEGHVEKELINVVLPTVPEGSTPFAYTMDPERLIQATSAARYAEGTTFPEAEDDTGVYFLTAENTYANSSNTLQAINKSSCAITLTVKVKTTQNTAKDIALATSSTVATTGTPNLYLGLKVGNETKVVSAEEQTVTKNIAGVPSNFEVAVQTNAETGAKSYVYQEKASATTWKAMNLSMEGAVSNLAVESDTTAPTVNVTWSYAKAADGAEAATDAVDYTASYLSASTISASSNSLTLSLPEDVTVSKLQLYTTEWVDLTPTTHYTVSGTTLTMVANELASWKENNLTRIKVIYSDDHEDEITLQ